MLTTLEIAQIEALINIVETDKGKDYLPAKKAKEMLKNHKSTNSISLYFDLKPRAKQSARHVVNKGKIKSYQNKDLKSWENAIKMMAKNQYKAEILTCGLAVKNLIYSFKALKSFTKKQNLEIAEKGYIYKITKPDLTDNLNKALFDALEGIVYKNDSQICVIKNAQKIYTNKNFIKLELKKI